MLRVLNGYRATSEYSRRYPRRTSCKDRAIRSRYAAWPVGCPASGRGEPQAAAQCSMSWDIPWGPDPSGVRGDRRVIARNRSRNSSGSNTSSRVPSCHAVFSSRALRPSRRGQGLRREGRAQYISEEAFQPRPIVRRHPQVGVQIEPFQMRQLRPARRRGG